MNETTLPDRGTYPGLAWRMEHAARSAVRYVAMNRWAGLITLVAIVVLATFAQIERKANPAATKLISLGDAHVALRLLDTGLSGKPPHIAHATPGYAAVLAATGFIDPRVKDALRCQTQKKACDTASLMTLYYVQGGVAVVTLLLVFATALRVSGRWEVAVLTLLLALASLRSGEWSSYPHNFVWAPAFLAAFIYLVSQAMLRASAPFAFLAGVCLAIAATFAPFAALAVPVAVMLFAAAAFTRTRSAPRSMLLGGGLLAGAGAIAAAVWAIDPGTNMVAATAGQFMHDLSHRIAFQDMDLATFAVGLVLPTPVVGSLFELASPAAITNNFSGYSNGSFNYHAVVTIYPKAIEQPGSVWNQLHWLIGTKLLGNFPAYLLSAPVVFAKIMWVNANLLALLGLIKLPAALRHARSDGRLFVLAPTFGTLVTIMVLYATLTSGHARVEDALIPLYAFAVAYVVARY